MKVSLTWLQKYFDTPLPGADAIADAFTFHAFEIEEMKGDLMDVKVLPNRAADCLSHRGIAKELSAILDVPLKHDPLRDPLSAFPQADALTVEIEDPKKCSRYMGALVKGVSVGPSPAWLREALEAVGQRSINNVVDATNYVMLDIGQPLHAFDAAKLVQKDGEYKIGVRSAKEGEKITTLSGEEYALTPGIQLITDAHADTSIALAGVKGGKAAELTSSTTDIIVESANFDGTTTRRAAQALRLFTDASLRFQNRPSPELAAYGMRDVLALIHDLAGGEVTGVVDAYPARPQAVPVAVSHAHVDGLLGSSFTIADIEEVFRRLGLDTSIENDVFAVTPPFERTDLVIPEDLIEEVGRITGYEKILATELPPLAAAPDQARYRGIERVKDFLTERGFTEISTQSFAKRGDVVLANPLDKGMPALRTSLDDNMQTALVQARLYAPLVLAPGQKPKLFEIGTVFAKDGEKLAVKTSEPVADMPSIEDANDYAPVRYELGAYKPFSLYPFIVRDIAMWIPKEISENEFRASFDTLVMNSFSNLSCTINFLDRFEKEGRVSYAFRLVFQSRERTLTDDEVNAVMDRVSAALRAAGYEVR
ncbi:MAG TPA: phenylalanine--tRNA ligase subunit beta [Candidatus Paceibacterota bacterium]|nr:phenylalanine--tRNA ligase subunit beta [Candidatus Paceibacterota bacterium]